MEDILPITILLYETLSAINHEGKGWLWQDVPIREELARTRTGGLDPSLPHWGGSPGLLAI